MAKILEEETGKGAFPAVLHCFTGGRDLAFKAIELGLYVSFTGILTFKNSDDLRDIARSCRPTAFWSRPTRPIWRRCRIAANATSRPYVVETAKVLAETRGVSPDEIARQTTENFFRLFSKVPRTLANAA